MSVFETLTIEKWLYSTLSADDTLAGLLAIDNRAKGYQIGIYNGVAPVKDSRSKNVPQLPYIVFDRIGTEEEYNRVICGSNITSYPSYRVTLWYAQSGSISASKVELIINRMVTLLDNQTVVLDGLTFKCFRSDTEQPIDVQTDGRVDYGYTAVYSFNIIL